MTTALEGGWRVSVITRPLFTPGKDPVPIVQEAGWVPGPVWTGAENLAPNGIRSPDRVARSQYLYRLRYPAHNVFIEHRVMFSCNWRNNLELFARKNPNVNILHMSYDGIIQRAFYVIIITMHLCTSHFVAACPLILYVFDSKFPCLWLQIPWSRQHRYEYF
jgi:hypothetical protein